MRIKAVITGLLLGCLVHAQTPRFVNYSSSDGLSSNTVYAVTQDANGLLWIGTRNGLNSFDGISFQGWKEFGRVNALTVDRDNHLWIGTQNGLYVRAGKDQKGPDGNIRALHADSDGNVWATVGDTLLLKLTWDHGIKELARCFYDKRDSEGDYPYYQIFEADDGRLWLGGRIVRMQYVADREHPKVIHPFGGGGFCPGSFAQAGGSLYLFDDHTSTLYTYKDVALMPVGRLPIAHARLLKDHKGQIWAAGSYGIGLVNLEKPEQTKVLKTSSTELYCLFEDAQGNLWTGGDNGLSVLCPALQHVHTISCDNVTALMQARDGKIWIGTAEKHVSSLYQDRDGTVYVGLWNNTGWEVWRNGRMHKERFSGPTPREQRTVAESFDGANWISDFLEDSRGHFWIVSWEGVGLNEWDRRAGKALPARWLSPFRYPYPQVDSSIYVSSRLGSRIIEDKDGNLVYATTQAGLNIINPETGHVTKYHRGNSTIPEDYVTDLALAPDGTVWAATRAGLWSPSGGHYLDGMLIQSLEADKAGRLWAGTEEGLYFIDTDGSIGIVKKGLGMPSDIYGERVSCILADGSLAFGGADGAVVFHPDSLLSISASSNLPLASLLKHRYRINSGPWVDKPFTGLPDKMIPGRYILETQSSDIFERWEGSPVIRSVIRIKPPVLVRWPFILLYIVLLSIAVWLIVRYRENRQRALVLQEELETRNRFFGIISHDLRGPVNGMKTLASALENAPEDKLRDGVKAISGAAAQTSAMLENILMWSVSQKGVLEPVIRDENLMDLVTGVISQLFTAAQEKGVHFTMYIPEGLTIPTDRHMLSTCLRNIMDNAVKYSPEGGTVSVWASASKIIISDQGPGMPADTLKALSRPGHLGLVITRELLEKMGASLTAHNLPEGGCELTIHLQYDKRSAD